MTRKSRLMTALIGALALLTAIAPSLQSKASEAGVGEAIPPPSAVVKVPVPSKSNHSPMSQSRLS